jgi:REP element-mobilizing transposase RayT
LTGYNYSQAGYYFITICTSGRCFLFGTVNNDEMILNKLGRIVSSNISDITNHIVGVTIDKFVVMPNHIHIILVVLADVVYLDAMYGVPTDSDSVWTSTTNAVKSKQIVPRAIQQFKASVSRETKTADIWQKKYHDHIIRNEDDYLHIWRYIDENPIKWKEDRYFQDGTNDV